MSSLSLYFLLKLDAFVTLFIILSVAALVPIFIMCFVWVFQSGIVDTDPIKSALLKWSKRLVPICLIFFIGAVFLPSTKQMAAIIVVPKVISSIESNKELMSIPDEVTSLASAWIKELRPENIKESAKTVKQQAKECQSGK